MKTNESWKNDDRGLPPSLDRMLGHPKDLCECGHERQQHQAVLGVPYKGACHKCRKDANEEKDGDRRDHQHRHRCREFNGKSSGENAERIRAETQP